MMGAIQLYPHFRLKSYSVGAGTSAIHSVDSSGFCCHSFIIDNGRAAGAAVAILAARQGEEKRHYLTRIIVIAAALMNDNAINFLLSVLHKYI